MSSNSESRRTVSAALGAAWLAVVPAMLFSAASHAGRHGAIERPKQPVYVAYNFDVTLDTAAPGEPSKVGDQDHLRVVLDRSTLDPKTQHVALLNVQHFLHGKFEPEHPDAAVMPVDDAWLDLSSKPYSLHYVARVVHGKPIVIEADEHTHRLTLRPQDHPEAILISGPYVIDPRPIMGPEVDAAATPGS